MPPWLVCRWYDAVYFATFTAFGFGHSLRVVGRRNMPAQGPALVIANHQSFLDPVLVGVASRRYLTFLARETLFRNRFMKSLLLSLNTVPIDLEGLGKAGIRNTLDALEKGRCVLVFPEGERTRDGRMLPFKPGISLLIKRMQCPIVPVGIAGAFAALSRSMKVPQFSPLFLRANPATLALSVGRPIQPAELAGMDRSELLEFLFGKVAAEVARAAGLKR